MGLGLAISHGTIRSLGGELSVQSTPNKGSTFRVTLPAGEAWRRRGASQRRTPELRAAARRRVLVVDDERLVGDAIARVLAEENDVVVETQAAEVLARLSRGERFDVILCDLMMPVMTGMDLYAELLRSNPSAVGRIVFMTGGAFTPRARAFLETVSNPCLEKPLDMSKLRGLIARAGATPGRS
jgi:CheY-like chemotaxis protein